MAIHIHDCPYSSLSSAQPSRLGAQVPADTIAATADRGDERVPHGHGHAATISVLRFVHPAHECWAAVLAGHLIASHSLSLQRIFIFIVNSGQRI